MLTQRLPIYKGRIVDLGLESVELPSGHRVELEVIRHPGAAAVVPLHDDGTITLVHQYRHAGGGMHFELPAGVLDNGEVPELCARRELREEVGLGCEELVRLGMIHTTPGFTDERIWIFLARGLTEIGAAPEPDEHLSPVRLTVARALELVDQGELTDAKTISGLFMLTRFLARASG